jgi:hypothetical protein
MIETITNYILYKSEILFFLFIYLFIYFMLLTAIKQKIVFFCYAVVIIDSLWAVRRIF